MGLGETRSLSPVNPPATSKCKMKAQLSCLQFLLQIAEVQGGDQRARFGHSRLRDGEEFKLPPCLRQTRVLHGSLILPDLYSALGSTLCRLGAGLSSGDPAERQAWACSWG